MPKTREDIDRMQRQEQQQHERAMDRQQQHKQILDRDKEQPAGSGHTPDRPEPEKSERR